MNILILTNEDNVEFVTKCVLEFGDTGQKYWFKYTGEYDWSEDYDIGISYMYQYRVPKEQLDKTWINFHPGLLPDYKGRNLCYHAIMNGAKRFGATAHYMDENFDTGCIIETFDFPVNESWTAQDLHDKTMEASQLLFKRLFLLILTRERFGCTANEGGTYYRKEPINDHVDFKAFPMDENSQTFLEAFERSVRAIVYGSHCPKIDIGGVTYKIVRDE